MLRSVHSVIDAGMKGSLNQRWCLRLLTLKIPTLKDRACLNTPLLHPSRLMLAICGKMVQLSSNLIFAETREAL